MRYWAHADDPSTTRNLQVPVRPINTLLSHKAINLSAELTGSEKRVAAAIIDHFNRKTSQCDPSLDGIAELIGMSRRTVIRAVDRLHKLGFIRRVRHGGKFHRNSYEPVWSRFRQAEMEWMKRRSARSAKFRGAKLSPYTRQTRHLGSDTADPQTFLENPIEETLAGTHSSQRPAAPSKIVEPRGLAGREGAGAADRVPFRLGSSLGAPAQSQRAATDAAERRWNTELMEHYGSNTEFYGRIVDAIDGKLMSSTTETELRKRGSGLAYLMGELAARDAAFAKRKRRR